MQTFLPHKDYEQCAKWLDPVRLNSQLNEALVIVRSLFGVYELNRQGVSGWANHTVAKMWTGHELQLARYALAVAEEQLYNRALSKADKVASLASRKKRVAIWNGLIEEMEDRDCPNDKPSLIGEEDFHSAFRALLLYKDIQSTTYKKWKHGEYPEHFCTKLLLPSKRSWKRDDYIRIWETFGQPDPTWYGQWGWKEDPDDMKVFYTEDRVSQIEKEKERKRLRPHKFWRKNNEQDNSSS